jgi:hypothetical protein
MARPKASAEQQNRAFQLWGSGMTIRATQILLGKEFTEPVSHGTVGTWFKKFKEGELLHSDSDQPFSWSEMSRFDLPDEASGVLIRVASLIGKFGDWKHLLHETHPVFTFRDAKWMWRVYCAVERKADYTPPIADFPDDYGLPAGAVVGAIPLPDGSMPLDFVEWLRFGRMFSDVERARLIAGLDVDTSLPEQALAYRPWESLENRRRYEDAIEAGHAVIESKDTLITYWSGLASAREAINRFENRIGPQERENHAD